MSAEYDVHAETESEDGGVPLAKAESDEMDIDAGSDTTPTSQDYGESSSSSTNAWGETLPSSFGDLTEDGNHTAEYQHTPTSLHEFFHDSMTPPFSAPEAALSSTSPPIPEALHNLETGFTVDFGTVDQVQYLHSALGGSHEDWTDQPNWSATNVLLSNGIQPPDSLAPDFWSAPSDVPQASTDLLFTAADNIIPTEYSEPEMYPLEDGTAEDTSLEDHATSAGTDHADGSDEDWLALSEDSYNIFNTDIAQGNGTFHTLSQASNMVSYYDLDDFEDNSNYFSVSFFLYYWKQMYMSRKTDYPCISQLANERAKVQRPEKITTNDRELCDYQGIHWSRYQTTKEEAREVRRMTYRNLRNLGPPEQKFATKAFKANFPGAVVPSSDLYFHFHEMDMKRSPDFSHFQLRHNLSATSKNAVFYTNRLPRDDAVSVLDTLKSQHKTIMCFNPESGTEKCAMDVKKGYNKADTKISKIHTLTAGNGVLVAGSFEGVYAMKSLSADFESAPVIGTIATGGDVSTNHIHTHLDRQSGLPRVVFDSNDRSVRILDCTTSKWVACHKYPYQVNCSTTSPDGRLRLLNGDDCQPIFANAETGETLAKLPGHNDFGFACDWAPDGITMATGHQDGLVKVWDARKLNKSIQTIAMEQAGCRSLLFSPLGSGKRVLVLAEPADFVHVVDAQTFESKQTIDFFGEISGISMPPDGSRLYIANADAKYGGLLEFERSWDSSKYNRRPFRVADLEGEHEEMVDCIVDGVQPAQRFPKPGDKLYQHVKPFMHGQGLPFVDQTFIEDLVIDCQRLFIGCLDRGGGQRVTASGEWSNVAQTFGVPRKEAVSFGQQLHQYWQDNIAPYETSLPFTQMMQEWQRATGRETTGRVASQTVHGQRKFSQSGEEGQYRRDYNDARRKAFKIGRKSETLDWLSESDMEDDARVNHPKGQRGRQWTSRPKVVDGFLSWMEM
ncbi:MAG: hypothetical protein ASARMPREDX12_002326 [Alectoria sarmentosa]|nr:MAG: hypothetical protein ASARMPRED_002172 [Alectoria sarmentosa]CAD6586294.1 MAG: hypothetical protein ASARMPREDX12_002326 [Alectoria sarmentosa]